jgi:hypothetical protein
MTAGGVVGLPEDPYDRNALGMPATLERQAHEGAGLTVLGDACFLDELSPQLPSLPNQAFNVLELSSRHSMFWSCLARSFFRRSPTARAAAGLLENSSKLTRGCLAVLIFMSPVMEISIGTEELMKGFRGLDRPNLSNCLKKLNLPALICERRRGVLCRSS